jgi:hypothetical protein
MLVVPLEMITLYVESIGVGGYESWKPDGTLKLYDGE